MCFHRRFDQSFETVKQVFNVFNLYKHVYRVLNATTRFSLPRMNPEDFSALKIIQVTPLVVYTMPKYI